MKPPWPIAKLRLLKRYGGVAFGYFNTSLRSSADYTLRLPTKAQAFKEAKSLGVASAELGQSGSRER